MNFIKEYITTPFQTAGKTSKAIVLVFLIINSIVLFNALRHDPNVGYDSPGHIRYIEVLSSGRFPTRTQTNEFFSPPLPYLFPAAIRSLGIPLKAAAKSAQFINFLLSLGLTFYLMKICDLIYPEKKQFKVLVLFFLGSMPVYYKTFSFIRGEPWLAFISLLAVYKALQFFIFDKRSLKNTISLGV